jgi:CDP-diacylglycerol--glycerol-3-phosphate 3-phosphatidyltransferase
LLGQLNLPNAITLFRIFLVPVLVVVILTRFEGKEWVGVGVFLVAAASDFFDGWIARRRRQVTPLGKLLDPMADKLLVSGAFISLVEVGVAPAWMVVVVIAREFAVTGLRAVAAERGLTIAASTWGKLKMGVQVACIVALLLSKPGVEHAHAVARLAGPVGRWLLWATVAVTVASGIEYFVTFRRVLEQPGGRRGEAA